jgi:type VI secretion system protein ImpB
MDDFNPLNVVQQIEPLRKLYEARTRLKDMQTKLDGNDALDVLLMDVMNKTETQKLLQQELGITDQSKRETKASDNGKKTLEPAKDKTQSAKPTKPSKK